MSQIKNKYLAQVPANTLKGNNTGSTANVADLTATQVTAMLNPFSATLQGLVPLSGGGTTNYLRADGTWAAAAGLTNPMTTAGDIIYGGVSGTPTRLATGTGVLVGGTTPSYSTTPTLTGTNFTGIPLTGLLAAAYNTAPTASVLAQFDANKNLSANSFLQGYTTTATAAGTTVLTVGSTQQQFFTGTTTQTVTMPVTSTLTLGMTYIIENNSTGVVTVNSSGANAIQAMAANTRLVLTVILITGTTAASWDAQYTAKGTIPVVLGGTGVTTVTTAATASAWVGWDASKNITANSFNTGYTTTATAAGTTTLVVGSTQIQYFTGTTTQTVVMPVTSTLTLGRQYTIENRSTGNVTVNSSGANAIQVMAPNTQLVLTCILITGTTAASWDAVYSSSSSTAVVYRANKVALSSAATTVTVTFSSTIGSTNYAITATMVNTTDTNPQIQEVICTAQSATAATFIWNAPLQTANYSLFYTAIANQ